MFEVSLPAFLGLKQTDEATFVPRRISMFPPSYTQRALARHMKRQGIKNGTATAVPPPLALPPPPEEPKPPEMVNSRNQTDMTWCYHECACHPPAKDSTSLSSGAVGKKGEKGEKGKAVHNLFFDS